MPDYTVTIERLITHHYTVECTADNPEAAAEAATDIVLMGNDDDLDHSYYDGLLEVTDVEEIELRGVRLKDRARRRLRAHIP